MAAAKPDEPQAEENLHFMNRWKQDIPAHFASSIPGVVFKDKGEGFSIDLPCSTCGETMVDVYSADAKEPAYRAMKALRTEGWKIGTTADRHTCPKHPKLIKAKPNRTKKEPAAVPDAGAQMKEREPEIAAQPALSLVPTPPPAAKAAPSLDALAAKREANAMIEQFYDLATRRYRDNINDAEIAKATGVAEPVVAKIREDFYGPLAPPDQFEELFAKLDALEARITKHDADAAETSRAMRAEATAIRDLLAERSKKNGWVS